MGLSAKKRARRWVATLFSLAVLLLVVSAVLYRGMPSYSGVKIGGKTFKVTSAASTPAGWEHGLMNATITNATLMVFLFPNSSVYSFWMFDTYSALDIIWSLNGKIVYIASDLPPCLTLPPSQCPIYTPTSAANLVVEARSGFVHRNNITVGENISLIR